MCDPAAVWNEQERTARKRHRCDECSRIIEPGTRYVNIGVVNDGSAYSIKQCIECTEFINKVMAEGLDYDGCYSIGSFYNDYAYEYWNAVRGLGPPHWFLMDMHRREIEDCMNDMSDEDVERCDKLWPSLDRFAHSGDSKTGNISWEMRKACHLSQAQSRYFFNRDYLKGKKLPESY